MTDRIVGIPQVKRSFILRLATAASVLLPLAGNAQCHNETLASIPTEDGLLIAVIQEVMCSDAGYATTAVTDAVHLLRPGIKLDASNQVFVVDEHGQPALRPKVRWISGTELQITVPNKSLIGILKRELDGIRVRVKFEPDNPQERQQWLQSLGLTDITER